ncbi:MAG: ATP-binding protein [Thermoanaerobaculia bacterium]
MRRIVVTGSECTGKTTLARALAAHYGTVWVPEYARDFVVRKGASPETGDVDAIARGQIAREDELEAEAAGLLILDTDLLSTLVYSRHYYGARPSWIGETLDRRAGDLYLLVGIDVPWVADGDQRDRGDRREEMQELFRRGLTDRKLRFTEIHGEHEARVSQAVAAIDHPGSRIPDGRLEGKRATALGVAAVSHKA